ncbi:hypothetical protein F2P79_005269 [Pimephales promelas]|nr:hypothetical protein F2P79_005269 [Pimephales promelas]
MNALSLSRSSAGRFCASVVETSDGDELSSLKRTSLICRRERVQLFLHQKHNFPERSPVTSTIRIWKFKPIQWRLHFRRCTTTSRFWPSRTPVSGRVLRLFNESLLSPVSSLPLNYQTPRISSRLTSLSPSLIGGDGI